MSEEEYENRIPIAIRMKFEIPGANPEPLVKPARSAIFGFRNS